jgi:hypothetical protein
MSRLWNAPLRRPWMLVALVLAVGVVGTYAALRAREGEPQFVSQQQSLTPVAPVALEHLLLTTSDPRPRLSGRARDVRCRSAAVGTSALGNPWSCVVRYPVLPRVRYRVTVRPDRSIEGIGQPEGKPLKGALIVKGCCVAQSP